MSQNDNSGLIRSHKDASDEQLEMSEPLGVAAFISSISKGRKGTHLGSDASNSRMTRSV